MNSTALLSLRRIILVVVLGLLLGLTATAQDAPSDLVEYTLHARISGEPVISYLGAGGDIDGQINPELVIDLGQTVRITLINDVDMTHDLTIDAFAVATPALAQGETATLEFVADQAGVFEYYGSMPGYRDIGMVGVLRVIDPAAAFPMANVVEFTVVTQLGGDPSMAFVGVGGAIDGIVNPELTVNLGDTVRLTVINGDPMQHDLKIDEFGVYTGDLLEDEQTVTIEFVADQPGAFKYYCSIPGHQQIGMEGVLRVVGEITVGEPSAMADSTEETYTEASGHDHGAASDAVKPAIADAVSIIRNPADVPPPVGDREPQHFRIDMETVEVNGVLADGTTYRYMTFDGQIPGPMIRLRIGDTVDFNLHNRDDSMLPHSIDLHAVTGPGGGAVYTQTLPGEDTQFSFKALQAGLYVYHCATSSIPHHISSGMYGLILVEPEGGLPPVDREFYFMQGELYTMQPYGTEGHLDFDYQKMLNEQAEYFVFNGAAAGLTTDETAMQTEVGDSVRVFFGVGGPNATSSFHLIGEIFDRVYDQASLTAAPLTDVQTTLVPPGGAVMVEFTMDVPGRYLFVDHALSRLERGLVAFLYAEGDDAPDIFDSTNLPEDSGH
ncbi:MAG: copper-containing nitrite reductase [Anaerolineae bacterium]|jgi:nitrite reductase (NO-forming)|nr:copper-containing nitrite reductase [Anaerolineae bacterium]